MPITPAAIPANYYAPLVKQGCFDADAVNQINALGAASDILVASVSNTGLGFAAFNSAAAVTLVPAGAVNAGTYAVNLYAVLTTAFATNTTWNFSLGFTDDQQAQTPIAFTSSTLTQGTALQGTYIFRSTGATAITYTPGKTGSAATAGVVAFSLTVQRIL
jgi:hypothetical protein